MIRDFNETFFEKMIKTVYRKTFINKTNLGRINKVNVK